MRRGGRSGRANRPIYTMALMELPGAPSLGEPGKSMVLINNSAGLGREP